MSSVAPDSIVEFKGANWFLSNFYPVWVEFEGDRYPSTENAYQAAKTVYALERRVFQHSHVTAREAKLWGRSIDLRPDWAQVCVSVMIQVVADKFSMKNPILRMSLRDTGSRHLVEGNYWGDTFWGFDLKKKTGANRLGMILMGARAAMVDGAGTSPEMRAYMLGFVEEALGERI